MENETNRDYSSAKDSIRKKFLEQGDFLIFEEALLDRMIDTAISLDEAYIASLDADAYYDDDKAFDYLLEGMQNTFPDQKMYMMRFVEDYMEYNEEYLDRNGLIDWY